MYMLITEGPSVGRPSTGLHTTQRRIGGFTLRLAHPTQQLKPLMRIGGSNHGPLNYSGYIANQLCQIH